MHTNDPIIVQFADKVEQMLHLPVPILLILSLNILAIIIRKSPLKNWTISLIIVILAAFLYPIISSGENTVFKSMGNLALHFQGVLLGGVSLAADLLLDKVPLYRVLTKAICSEKKSKKYKKSKSHKKSIN